MTRSQVYSRSCLMPLHHHRMQCLLSCIIVFVFCSSFLLFAFRDVGDANLITVKDRKEDRKCICDPKDKTKNKKVGGQDDPQHDPIDAVYTWVNGSDPLLIESLMRVRHNNRKQQKPFENYFFRTLDSWSLQQRCYPHTRRSGVTRSYDTFLEMLPAFVIKPRMTASPQETERSMDANSMTGVSAGFSWIPFSSSLASLVMEIEKGGTFLLQEQVALHGNLDGKGRLHQAFTSDKASDKASDKGEGKRNSRPEAFLKTPFSSSRPLVYYYSSLHGVDKREEFSPSLHTSYSLFHV